MIKKTGLFSIKKEIFGIKWMGKSKKKDHAKKCKKI
jgi:hypothetical protein